MFPSGILSVVLVGDAFLRVAGELGRAWSESGRGSVRVVVVEGGHGSGKTRLVQSLYEQVMALADAPTHPGTGVPLDEHGLLIDPLPVDEHGQPINSLPPSGQPQMSGPSRVRYWPASLREPAPTPELAATGVPFVAAGTPRWRSMDSDAVFPGGAWSPPAGSRLRVFWWGMRGREGSCAALEASGQITAHLSGLRAALAAGDALTKTRVKALLDTSCWINALVALTVPPLTAAGIVKAGLDTASVVKDVPATLTGVREALQTRHGMIEQALQPAQLRQLDLSIGQGGWTRPAPRSRRWRRLPRSSRSRSRSMTRTNWTPSRWRGCVPCLSPAPPEP